jgi:hypothetical protein
MRFLSDLLALFAHTFVHPAFKFFTRLSLEIKFVLILNNT